MSLLHLGASAVLIESDDCIKGVTNIPASGVGPAEPSHPRVAYQYLPSPCCFATCQLSSLLLVYHAPRRPTGRSHPDKSHPSC